MKSQPRLFTNKTALVSGLGAFLPPSCNASCRRNIYDLQMDEAARVAAAAGISEKRNSIVMIQVQFYITNFANWQD